MLGGDGLERIEGNRGSDESTAATATTPYKVAAATT